MANYWQDRFVQLEKAQMNKGIEYYHELEKQYSKAAEEVQKEIMKWYGRLAKNNEISVSEARKLLTKDELQEFKWSVETYIQKGRENDIDGRWMKELENASAKVHINRLEAMKLQMQQQVEMLYGNEIDSFDKHIRDTYTEGFYRTAYEIQKGLGVGTNLAKLDTEKVNRIIAKPWAADGSNFSSRIWKQKNQLVNELHNGLSQAFIRGTEPYDLTKQISERFKVSKGQAGRLVMTETAYFHSAAQIDAFKELGVKEYEITAVLDSRTSELCRDMDGKHLPVSEFKAGITAPPFHCWCRSTTVPYFNDEFTEEETRIARGEDDKLYEVPYNMTYRQWEKKFVKDTISEANIDLHSEFSKILGDKAPSIEEFVKIKYDNDEWKLFKTYTSSIKSGELTPLADFELYKTISNEMDEKLIGIVTSNNITITDKSNHSIARVIGSIEQRRNGVQVSDVLDALTSSDSEILPIRESKNGRSQKFRNKVVEVSVNPDTGNIIQVNPVHTRKKDRS